MRGAGALAGQQSRPARLHWLTELPARLGSLRSQAAGMPRRLTERWRSSLQLRVITATLLLSALVVAVLGFLLMQRVASNLIDSKESSAKALAEQGLTTAQEEPAFLPEPSSTSGSGTSPQQLMYRLACTLATCQASSSKLQPAGSSSLGLDYAFMVRLAPSASLQPQSPGWSAGFYQLPSLPQRLVTQVDQQAVDHTNPMLCAAANVALGSNPARGPGLACGAKFGSQYELYYVFPLTDVQQSISHIERILLLVGLALVFLLAAIAWLVTRWVVIPVRQAAQGARRLSTGSLTERMPVRGSDELAALATSFNEMATSLQEKLAELEDLSQVQRQFVSDVSHELRTPLTTIRIAADVLSASKNRLDHDAARSAELLQSQLERFESLLTDLLEISRYDANAATLDAEPVDVCSLVRQSAELAQQLAERRGTKIQFRLPAGPCIAEVDRRRVERILRNLLLNAVEHGENHDTLVSVAADSGAVAVAVRDFGVGLAPGEEQLVFDRFWRADPARARTSGGTGLGLAIALEDARLHGGWLEAWGQPGLGSVFRLTLPRTVGCELVGSPLPLVPDQLHLYPEVAPEEEIASADGLEGTAGQRAVGPAVPVAPNGGSLAAAGLDADGLLDRADADMFSGRPYEAPQLAGVVDEAVAASAPLQAAGRARGGVTGDDSVDSGVAGD
jgi:two-component system, OmpR family, sensor histidine kinase MtrB